ncbi:hypothetical protein POM88_022547 [Heracleum sosnowskyi]|uniref:Uncharacterized protein n=1 Tax=Heracleum sosnowskyi TaxID=360622 RepID=A0AAD8MTX1_9APIA|nr:hypothetical protein POM88_022547 [Heracleum sosnowskyi]
MKICVVGAGTTSIFDNVTHSSKKILDIAFAPSKGFSFRAPTYWKQMQINSHFYSIGCGTRKSGIQKSTAPEMLLALMDEAYTGSIGADSESKDNNTMALGNPLFIDSLKDEN